MLPHDRRSPALTDLAPNTSLASRHGVHSVAANSDASGLLDGRLGDLASQYGVHCVATRDCDDEGPDEQGMIVISVPACAGASYWVYMIRAQEWVNVRRHEMWRKCGRFLFCRSIVLQN